MAAPIAVLIAATRWRDGDRSVYAMRKEVFERLQKSLDRQLERRLDEVAHHEAGHAVVRCSPAMRSRRSRCDPPYREPEAHGTATNFSEVSRTPASNPTNSILQDTAAGRRSTPRSSSPGDLPRLVTGDVPFPRAGRGPMRSSLLGTYFHHTPKQPDGTAPESYFRHSAAHVRTTLEAAWPQVRAVATALAERRELSGDEVREMVMGPRVESATARGRRPISGDPGD